MADRWQTSRELLDRARQSLCGGVSSPFRASFPVPLYFEDGNGARLLDVDSNEYIDYTLAWGPNILGYRHPKVAEAVSRQAMSVHTYGAQHRLEPEVAEKFQAAVPCAERVAFTSSGSEAVQLVFRLARAYTNRKYILKFEGHYHGWMDSVFLSYRAPADKFGPVDAPTVALGSRGQVENSAGNVIAAPWNDLAFLERLFAERGHEIAGVITEPVLCNSGCILPEPGFLAGLRALTRKHGTLLIFDEVITGFRISLGGAQAHFGVTPDLATFGKAIAAGMPLSAVAGRKDIMEEMYKGVAFGGTFNGNPMSLAAANAALDVLSANDGTILKEANALGSQLMEKISAHGKAAGVPLYVCGFGTAFALHFTPVTGMKHYRDTWADDKEKLTRYIKGMLEEGVYLLPDGRVYTSCAHTEREIQETATAAQKVLASLA
ncbi:MAG: aspartate aminotransferase family protein [Bryobacterales bacterium]|nr:aspartate aminotransferase family protein [Bryobacterales bacterium]